MAPPHTALISDDLTGALDSAAPFALMGWRTVVATGLESLGRALQSQADVVAVSLNSREIDSFEAGKRAREASQLLVHVPKIFKKIDSRMKGHVVAETAEIAAVRSVRHIVVCPAIPELGRCVIRGHVIGHGIDQPIPVRLPLQGGIEVACPDASSDADLAVVVANSDAGLLVGARGMASALARSIGSPPGRVGQTQSLDFPITFVVGSTDPTTLEQVAYLRAAYPSACWVGAPDGVARPTDTSSDITIIQALPGEGADGATVAARLAKAVKSDYVAGRKTVLATGGETASACLREMGAGVLLLIGEAQVGMPISLPLDMSEAPYIITKSGGFGDPECLAGLVRSLNDQGMR